MTRYCLFLWLNRSTALESDAARLTYLDVYKTLARPKPAAVRCTHAVEFSKTAALSGPRGTPSCLALRCPANRAD
jgi:hypothetical protein